MVATAMAKTSPSAEGKYLADESIIGTILNGYETSNPYGRRVHRASVIVLSSLIDEKVAEAISTTLRRIFHTDNVRSIAGSSLRYQAMRNAFPHERDALILDATDASLSITLVRKDLFTALIEIVDMPSGSAWTERVMKEFAAIALKYPLPRVIFLLARESELATFQQALEVAPSGGLGTLWISDSPPKVVPLIASHLSNAVRQATATPPDLQLLLMALYYARFAGQRR
jgi:hypothetical protein